MTTETEMVTTSHGDMPVSALRRVDGELDNEDEYTTWVEFWMRVPLTEPFVVDLKEHEGHDIMEMFEGEPWERVHRSVHVTLKKMPPMGAEAGGLGG